MDANSQNIYLLVMDLHLLDNKLENEGLLSVSCNNYYSTVNICIMMYHLVFTLHLLFILQTGNLNACVCKFTRCKAFKLRPQHSYCFSGKLSDSNTLKFGAFCMFCSFYGS